MSMDQDFRSHTYGTQRRGAILGLKRIRLEKIIGSLILGRVEIACDLKIYLPSHKRLKVSLHLDVIKHSVLSLVDLGDAWA